MNKIQILEGINYLEDLKNECTLNNFIANFDSGIYSTDLKDSDNVLIYIDKNNRIDIAHKTLSEDEGYVNKDGFKNYINNISKIEKVEKFKNSITLHNSEVVKDLIETTETGVYSGISSDNEEILVHISKNNRMDVYIYQKDGQIGDIGYNKYGNQDYIEYIGKYRKIS